MSGASAETTELRFWDSSAIVALHIEHGFTKRLRELLGLDPDVVAWTLRGRAETSPRRLS
jgi:hypothetical protein